MEYVWNTHMILQIKAADEGLVWWPTFDVYLSILTVSVTLHNILE